MEQIKLTTISARLSDEGDTDEDSDFLPSITPASLSTLTVSEDSEVLDDKEWLFKNKHTSARVSSRRGDHNGDHAGRHSRRGSLKFDNVEYIIKMCAMACACTFGVGSHFASHIIGPMKGILMEVLYLLYVQTP